MSISIDHLPSRPLPPVPMARDRPAGRAIAATAVPQAPASAAPPPRPAFADILDWHGVEIYRFALRLARNRPDADDLYQETMLKAYRAFPRLPPDANHRAWLYRIASNAFLSDRRKRDRVDSLDALGGASPGHPGHPGLDLPAPEPDHAARLDARALLGEVAAAIAALPPKQRVALTLRKFHGVGYDEIAAVLACSEGAARTNVHVALTKLRERIGERL